VGTEGGTGQNLMTPSWKGVPDDLHDMQINSTELMLWKEPKWPSFVHHTPCPSVSYLIAGRFPFSGILKPLAFLGFTGVYWAAFARH
jgi:hypothetical protein